MVKRVFELKTTTLRLVVFALLLVLGPVFGSAASSQPILSLCESAKASISLVKSVVDGPKDSFVYGSPPFGTWPDAASFLAPRAPACGSRPFGS